MRTTNPVKTGNIKLILTPGLSDGDYTGIAETGVAGTALAFGDVVYQSQTDNKWELAKADAEGTCRGKLGICISAASEDSESTAGAQTVCDVICECRAVAAGGYLA